MVKRGPKRSQKWSKMCQNRPKSNACLVVCARGGIYPALCPAAGLRLTHVLHVSFRTESRAGRSGSVASRGFAFVSRNEGRGNHLILKTRFWQKRHFSGFFFGGHLRQRAAPDQAHLIENRFL